MGSFRNKLKTMWSVLGPPATWQTRLWDVPPHKASSTLLYDLPPMKIPEWQRQGQGPPEKPE